jgi:hypothetical protein
MAEETKYDYEVALSFAGEDREFVEEVASELRKAGIEYFLDSEHLSETWGEDLGEFFDSLFRKRARYAVIFVSRHYVDKPWTRHERRCALDRAIQQRSAYVLPVRLDDIDVPGLRSSTCHLDARRIGIDGIVRTLREKLIGRDAASESVVPRTKVELDSLIRNRPPVWEHRQFVAELTMGMDALENLFHDYETHYWSPSGERLQAHETARFLSNASKEAGRLVQNFHAVMDPAVQERAFGAPGLPGDPERISHLAHRWTTTYQSFIEWALRVRGVIVPEEWERAFELLARYVDDPIRKYRAFVTEFRARIAEAPAQLARDEQVRVELTLHLVIPQDLEAEFSAELDQLTRLAAVG